MNAMNENNELQALRAALKVSPDNIPLLKVFATACVENWALGEAKSAFDKILELDAQDKDALIGLVQVLFQMGKSSEASVRIDALMSKYPKDPAVLLASAKIKSSEGDHRLAHEQYLEARSIDAAIQDGALEKELADAGFRVSSVSPSSDKNVLNTSAGWVQRDDDDDDEDEDEESAEDIEDLLDVENPQINFTDVGGMENIKEEIRLKIIYPSKNPEIYKAYGKKSGGGVLLYGPPGCGKTLVSRATAGEIKSNFISIGLHQILDMYVGNSEKNLHEIFELARNNTPSVLFIDEIDALAANRTDMRQSASRTLINQLLAEMDGDVSSNDGVLILGATNAPWYIDSAFRRPGRFDRIIFVPTPDEAARLEILKVLVKGVPVDKLDFKTLAKKTNNFSGADLQSMFDLAKEASLTRAMKENRVIPITTNDLLKQAKGIVPSSKAWFESAKNYALYSNQSGLYDPILAFLGIKK